MTDLIFYTNPMSRGRIVRWMLEETGADYETKILDYGPPMKAPEYLAVNPMGKVPAIQHGTTIVTECAAICAYLADAFPDAGLAPAPAERGSYYRWLFFAAGPLEAAVINKTLAAHVPEDMEKMVGYGTYPQVLDTLDATLSANNFAAGDQFSAADVYLGSHIGWGMEFKTIEPRPAFTAYFNRVSNRPAYDRAQMLDNALMASEE